MFNTMPDTMPGTTRLVYRFAAPRPSRPDWGQVATVSVVLLSSCLLVELVVGPASPGHGLRLGVFSMATAVNLMLEMIRQERRAPRDQLAAAEMRALARAFQSAPGTAVPIEGRVCMSH